MRNRLRRVTLIFALLAVACARDEERLVRLQLERPGEVLVLPQPMFLWFAVPTTAADQAFWMRPGDLIYPVSADLGVPYLSTDEQPLRLSSTGWSVKLAGEVVGVALDDSGSAWAAAASVEELSRLRAVSTRRPSAAASRAIKRIAGAKPVLDLWVSDQALLNELMQEFRPGLLALSNDSVRLDSAHLGGLQNVHTLILGGGDPGALALLRQMPRLRRLIHMPGGEEESALLPYQIENLTSLTVYADDTLDLSRIEGLSNLEELNLLAPFRNLEIVQRLDLHTVFSTAGVARAVRPGRLRSLGLIDPAQEDFNALVAAHPNLERLDIAGDRMLDLTPLRDLRRLKSLILSGDSYSNLAVLRELSSLRYLGLPDSLWTDSQDELAAIRAALPQTHIASVKPVCLGSGWILLVPSVVLLMGVMPRRIPAAQVH